MIPSTMDIASTLSLLLTMMIGWLCLSETTSCGHWCYTTKPHIVENLTTTELGVQYVIIMRIASAPNDTCCTLRRESLHLGDMSTVGNHSRDYLILACESASFTVIIPDTWLIGDRVSFKHLNVFGCDVSWPSVTRLATHITSVELTMTLPHTMSCSDKTSEMVPFRDVQVTTLTFTSVRDDSNADIARTGNKCDYGDYLQHIPHTAFSRVRSFQFLDIDLSRVQTTPFIQGFRLGLASFQRSNLTTVPGLHFTNGGYHSPPIITLLELNIQHNKARTFTWETQKEQELFTRIDTSTNTDPRNTTILWLRDNAISRLPSHRKLGRIDYLDLSGNLMTSQTVSSLAEVRKATRIDISHNPIESLPDNTFDHFSNLLYLSLSNCSLNNITNVRWRNNKALIKLDMSYNHMTSVNLSQIVTKVPSLQAVDVQRSNLREVVFGDNPSHSLVWVDVLGNNLTTFPRDLLGIEAIRLLGNTITTEGMSTLTHTALHHGVLFHKGSINLQYNCIEYIPLDTGEQVERLSAVLSLYELPLHGNPLHCGCAEFKAWVSSMGVHHTDNLLCDTRNLTEASRKELRRLFPTTHCHMSSKTTRFPYQCQSMLMLHHRVTVGLVVTVLLCLCAIVITLVYRFRYKITQTIFITTGLRLQRNCCKASHVYEYDAYVAYCDADRIWVIRNLVKPLETMDPPYRLCLYDRDFSLGGDTCLTTMEKMALSRTTLIVLSSAMGESSWCSFQINAAIEERRLRGQPFSATPVSRDYFDHSTLTPAQRVYMGAMPTIKKGDRQFYRKLEFALGSPISGGGHREPGEGLPSVDQLQYYNSSNSLQDELE